MRTSKNCQTPDMWTSLVEDFRVKTLALQEKVLVSPEVALDYGVRCIEECGNMACLNFQREDNQDVIFLEVKENKYE